MAVSNQLRFFPLVLRALLGTDIAVPGTYYAIGGGLERECRLLKIDNLTNELVFISSNAVDAWTVVPSGGFILLDVTSNKSNLTELLIDKGTQFYATALVSPVNGSVYVTAIGSSAGL